MRKVAQDRNDPRISSIRPAPDSLRPVAVDCARAFRAGVTPDPVPPRPRRRPSTWAPRIILGLMALVAGSSAGGALALAPTATASTHPSTRARHAVVRSHEDFVLATPLFVTSIAKPHVRHARRTAKAAPETPAAAVEPARDDTADAAAVLDRARDERGFD